VLVKEDLHWADRSTLDLLSFLARNLGAMRVMLIGTYRSDEMRRTHALRPVLAELSRLPLVQRIELQPMDEDEVVQLFTAIRGNQPPPEEALSILTRSDGNPFYVEELLAAGSFSLALRARASISATKGAVPIERALWCAAASSASASGTSPAATSASASRKRAYAGSTVFQPAPGRRQCHVYEWTRIAGYEA